EVHVYSYEFDTSLPDNIKAIMSKVSTTRNAKEVETLEKYHKDGVKIVSRVDFPQNAVYAVAFRPDGQVLATAGADGTVRLYNPETGALVKEFAPAAASKDDSSRTEQVATVTPKSEEATETETLPQGVTIASLQVQPESINLTSRFAYTQVLVTAKLDAGDQIDVTRIAETQLSTPIAEISKSGLV